MAQHIKDNHNLVDFFLNNEYKIFTSIKNIDNRFLNAIRREKGVGLSMVNPEQEYNKTDVVIEGLPNKRLIITGNSTSQINFVLYENGGNTLYNICFIYEKKRKRNYSIAVLRLDHEINTLDKLRTAVILKKFTVMK